MKKNNNIIFEQSSNIDCKTILIFEQSSNIDCKAIFPMEEILYLFIHVLTIIIVHGHVSIIKRDLNDIFLNPTPLFDDIIYFLSGVWVILLFTIFVTWCYKFTTYIFHLF